MILQFIFVFRNISGEHQAQAIPNGLAYFSFVYMFFRVFYRKYIFKVAHRPKSHIQYAFDALDIYLHNSNANGTKHSISF